MPGAAGTAAAEVLVDRVDHVELLGEPRRGQPVGDGQPRRVVGQHEVLVAELHRGHRHLLDRRAAVGPVRVRVQVAAQRGAQLLAAGGERPRASPPARRGTPAPRRPAPRRSRASVASPMPGRSRSVPARAPRPSSSGGAAGRGRGAAEGLDPVGRRSRRSSRNAIRRSAATGPSASAGPGVIHRVVHRSSTAVRRGHPPVAFSGSFIARACPVHSRLLHRRWSVSGVGRRGARRVTHSLCTVDTVHLDTVRPRHRAPRHRAPDDTCTVHHRPGRTACSRCPHVIHRLCTELSTGVDGPAVDRPGAPGPRVAPDEALGPLAYAARLGKANGVPTGGGPPPERGGNTSRPGLGQEQGRAWRRGRDR